MVKAITWKDDLIVDQLRQNRRFGRFIKILAPVWLLVILGDAAFYWHKGGAADAWACVIVGVTSLLIVVVMIKAHCILQLRQMRSIPPVTVTASEIKIGTTLIQRTDIMRIEIGKRGRSKR